MKQITINILCILVLTMPFIVFSQTICNTPKTITIQGLSNTYKTNYLPVTLQALPTGGTFYGTGVISNKFYPSTLTEGSYTIVYVYVDSIGCSSVLCNDIEIQKPTGIDTVVQNSDFYLTPNPSSTGIYNLNFNLLCSSDIQFSVFDIVGKSISNKTINYTTTGLITETIDISAQPRGVYFLRVLIGQEGKTFKILYN